jgi:hypothetical protein
MSGTTLTPNIHPTNEGAKMASKTKADERVVTRVASSGIYTEGVYSKRYWPNLKPYWVLLRWRVTVDGKAGDWHKVHGNQKCSCAGFALLLDN